MKERENETRAYKPINETLIFVIFQVVLFGRDIQLLTDIKQKIQNFGGWARFISFTFLLLQ